MYWLNNYRARREFFQRQRLIQQLMRPNRTTYQSQKTCQQLRTEPKFQKFAAFTVNHQFLEVNLWKSVMSRFHSAQIGPNPCPEVF